MASKSEVLTEQAVKVLRAELVADGGDAELVELTPEKVAVIRYTQPTNDDCADCVMSPGEFEAFASALIRDRVPEVDAVRVV